MRVSPLLALLRDVLGSPRRWLWPFFAGLAGGVVSGGAWWLVVIYSSNLLIEFQTLATGVLAVFAAGIAFVGAIYSARIHANAIHKDRIEQAHLEILKLKREKIIDAVHFITALRAATREVKFWSNQFDDTLNKFKSDMKIGEYLYLLSVHRPIANEIYRSKWENFALLNPRIASSVYLSTSLLDNIERMVVIANESFSNISRDMKTTSIDLSVTVSMFLTVNKSIIKLTDEIEWREKKIIH